MSKKGRVLTSFVCLLLEGVFILLFSRSKENIGLSIFFLVMLSIFNQAANGACYGIVPYVIPGGIGAVSGFVGAGGNIGAVCWGFLFIAYPLLDGFMILGIIIIIGSFLTLPITISGYKGLIFSRNSSPEKSEKNKG